MQGSEFKSKYCQETIIKNTKFDDIDKISNLTQEEIENLNRLITIRKIEAK
jgi:ribosomal protein S13